MDHPQTNTMSGNFVHMVFFWLKEPENEKAQERFEKELKSFIENVPEIASSHIGSPAGTPDRDVVDKSFSYCLVTSFKGRKDYDVYAEHPLHYKFIENAGDLWEKVIVYDSDMI